MSDVISEYQKWKQHGHELRAQARQAMESRFRDLLAEAAQIAEEYRADFGVPLKPQSPITAFRYKSGGKGKARKAAKTAKPAKPESSPQAAPAKPNPKVAALQKRLAAAKKKLEDAKAAGKPTRALEDKTYELEDELRLSSQS
jgi:hypothetical protein